MTIKTPGLVLACLCLVGFARQGPAVATLSIFIEPLTREFGWSRTAISGAVSLAGVMAALASPLVGPLLDRHGARLLLAAAVLVNAAALFLLSFTPSLLVFYVLFCIARTNWAVPFDLGIYGMVSKWFVERRAAAASAATVAQMAGLVAMPLIAAAAMGAGGWRAGWVALAAATVLVGLVPALLLPPGRAVPSGRAQAEPQFSRRQAVRTPAFWLLMLYTVLIFPVQAGVSLHQAPHLVERGLSPGNAALVVSAFSFMSGVGTLVFGFLPRRLPSRYPLALLGALIAMGAFLMTRIASPAHAYLAAAIFGLGLGGVLTLLPVAWADYFGRENYGAIRGLALSAQVLAQAVGPVLSGVLRDLTGDYRLALYTFTALAGLSVAAALAARRPSVSRPRADGDPV